MSLLPCNVDEIANKIKQDTSNKKYAFLAIYTKDANVSLLQKIKSDVPIMTLDTLSITDCFKWLSSEMGEICSSNSVNPTVNCDWMEAFSIGESCGSSEICFESSGSIGIGFGTYDIDNESDIDDWTDNLGSSVGFDSDNNESDHSSFDWLEGLFNDSDNNSPTTFESNPLHLRDSGRIPKYISAEEELKRFHKDYHDKAIEKDVYSSLFAPAEVTSIAKGAFECDGLKSVVSLITEPFDLGSSKSDVFSTCDTLYVPKGTKALYASNQSLLPFIKCRRLLMRMGPTTPSTANS